MLKKTLILTISTLFLSASVMASAGQEPIEATLLNDMNSVSQTNPSTPDKDAAQLSQTYQTMSDEIAVQQTNTRAVSSSIFDISIFPALISIINIIETQCDHLIALILPNHASQKSNEAEVKGVLNSIESQQSTLSKFISPQNAPTYQVNDYNNPSIPDNMRKTEPREAQIYGN